MIDYYWNTKKLYYITFISETSIGGYSDKQVFKRYVALPSEIDDQHASKLIQTYLPNISELTYIEEIEDILSFKSIFEYE